MKQIIPEIYVRNCKSALAFYRRTLGGEVKNLRMSEDLPMFSHLKEKVVHAELHLENRCTLYFVDASLDPKRGQEGNVTVMLHMESREELERVYQGLSQGGKIGMELQETFWGGWHAIVTDRHRMTWAMNYSQK